MCILKLVDFIVSIFGLIKFGYYCYVHCNHAAIIDGVKILYIQANMVFVQKIFHKGKNLQTGKSYVSIAMGSILLGKQQHLGCKKVVWPRKTTV